MAYRFCLFFLILTIVILPQFIQADVNNLQSENSSSPPLVCSEKALAALKAIPPIKMRCQDSFEDNPQHPRRQQALKLYLNKLETYFKSSSWWDVSVAELNACAVTNEARPLTEQESGSLRDDTYLFGDSSTRLVVAIDPCVRYSYSTRNAFILQRVGKRVYATRVLDAYYTRFDPGIGMAIAQHNGEKLLFVKKDNYDFPGIAPTVDYQVYTIDARTHRAVARKIFLDNKDKPTNQFSYTAYLISDAELAEQWNEPEIIFNGKLAMEFYVHEINPIERDRTDSKAQNESNDENESEPEYQIDHYTYRWNGKYYEMRPNAK